MGNAIMSGVEKQYKLIEEITLSADATIISRNQDTNGNPYNFKKLFVYIAVPVSSAAPGTNVEIFRNNDYTSKIINSFINASSATNTKKHGITEFTSDGGYWKAFMMAYGAGGIITVQGYPHVWNVVEPQISIQSVKISAAGALPSGTNIKIYGIEE